MTDPRRHEEFHRIMAVGTVASALARQVSDLTPVLDDDLPQWLIQLPLPAGWLLAQFDASAAQPARMAVCGAHPEIGWDGCEIIGVFRFTGAPGDSLLRHASDHMLRDLGADAIITTALSFEPNAGVSAAQGTGKFSVVGRDLWLQYSTYLAGSKSPGAGLLIEHGIYVESAHRARLRDAIAWLSDNLRVAVAANIAQTPGSGMPTAAGPSMPIEAAGSEGGEMAIFRVGFFPDFDIGNDVVLVGADRDGMREFQSALEAAHEHRHATFELHGIQHQVVREDGAADIEFGWQTVVWRFDDARLVEALSLIEPLIDSQTPGHTYMDELDSPAGTLLLSVDEYTTGGPFAEFPQGLPLPTQP